MSDDLMRYEDMAREALRGVVREALRRVAEDGGLPGDHHFYITFRTRAAGVDIDEQLLATHPAEMTVVLEHRFWDLEVDEEAFEVTLTFNRIPKYIRVPFAAVIQFHDPSVGFALRFDAPPAEGTSEPKAEDAAAPESEPEPPRGEVVSFEAFRKKSE